MDFELASLDPREVQNVVDDMQQRLARLQRHAEHALGFVVQRAQAEQLQHAEQGIERGAYLVAHGGQEYVFDLRQALRLQARQFQFGSALGHAPL